MRRHHDGFVIAMTLGPIAVGVWVFLAWRSSGRLPFDISFSQLPSISLPNITLPQLQAQLPLPLVSASAWLGAHAWVMGLGIAAGALGGVIAVGTLADIVRGIIHLVARNRAVSRFPQPQSSDEIS